MKDKKDLVSIIVPTYNRAQLCRIAVESALSQTHCKIEVIVVDDGSIDDTKNVISDIDPRVKYIWQKNSGVSTARNTGLKAATGDYIAFLDSDDVWLPWKLEAQLSVLRLFPNIGMVWTDMKAIDMSGVTLHESYIKKMYSTYKHFNRDNHFSHNQTLSEIWSECPDEYANQKWYSGNIFSWMFMGNLVHTSTVLLRRERYEAVGLFDVSLIKAGEDYDYHFRTCRFGDVAYLDVPSILYRIGGSDQITEQNNNIWFARHNLVTVKKMLSEAKQEIKLPQKMIRSRIAECYNWIGFSEFLEKPANATPYLLKSLFYSPFQLRVMAHLLLSLLPNGTKDRLRSIRNAIKNRAVSQSNNNTDSN